MRRTLVSLAAMAAAGAARAQPPAPLFGRPEPTPVELPVPRIGPLLYDPDSAAMQELRQALDREIQKVMADPSQKIGKTQYATMELRKHQVLALRWAEEHQPLTSSWPAGWGKAWGEAWGEPWAG